MHNESTTVQHGQGRKGNFNIPSRVTCFRSISIPFSEVVIDFFLFHFTPFHLSSFHVNRLNLLCFSPFVFVRFSPFHPISPHVRFHSSVLPFFPCHSFSFRFTIFTPFVLFLSFPLPCLALFHFPSFHTRYAHSLYILIFPLDHFLHVNYLVFIPVHSFSSFRSTPFLFFLGAWHSAFISVPRHLVSARFCAAVHRNALRSILVISNQFIQPSPPSLPLQPILYSVQF